MGIAEANNPTAIRSQPAQGARAIGLSQVLLQGRTALVGAVFIGSPKGRRKVLEIIRSGTICETPAEREALFDVR